VDSGTGPSDGEKRAPITLVYELDDAEAGTGPANDDAEQADDMRVGAGKNDGYEGAEVGSGLSAEAEDFSDEWGRPVDLMSGSTGTIGIASYSCAAPSSSPPRHPHPQAPCFDTDFAKLLTRHLALNPEPYIDLNPRRAKPGFGLLIQAEAFTWLCNQLSLAAGLRKLVLDLEGRAAAAVLERLNKLSRLPQLDSLQLRGMALSSDHLVAVLPRLARLTRLVLRFDWDHWDAIGGCQDAFPWAAAVCGLVNLRELRVTSVADVEHSCTSMFKGALPAAMSRLTALRCLDVLGMREWDVRLDDGDQLQLAALPALETAALRLHTLCGGYPGLCGESQVVLSRLVSLSLGLRVDTEAGDCCTDMHLPIIVAPALTRRRQRALGC